MSWLRNNDQKLALAAGYALVALLFWSLGKYSAKTNPPDIRIEEPAIDLTKINNNLNAINSQLNDGSGQVAGDSAVSDCGGKIKGNISSSGKIYHLPGGAFYNRTVPEACFSTEAEAQAAGFRKSKN